MTKRSTSVLQLSWAFLCFAQACAAAEESKYCHYTDAIGNVYDLSGIGKPPEPLPCAPSSCSSIAKDRNVIVNVCQPLPESRVKDCKGFKAGQEVLGIYKFKDSDSCTVLGFLESEPRFTTGSNYLGVAYRGSTCKLSKYELRYEFYCDSGATSDEYELVSLDKAGCSYTVKITSKSACATPPPTVLSPFVCVLLGLLGVFTCYCFSGCLYNTQFRGASGLESVPHVDFWRKFLGYVEEGALWFWLKVTCQNDKRTTMHKSLIQDDELGQDGSPDAEGLSEHEVKHTVTHL